MITIKFPKKIKQNRPMDRDENLERTFDLMGVGLAEFDSGTEYGCCLLAKF